MSIFVTFASGGVGGPDGWPTRASTVPFDGYEQEMSEEEFNSLRTAMRPAYTVWRIANPPPPPPPEVPWAISNADLRRQLAMAGINPALILAYLNSLEEGQAKWLALSDWEYANYFERAHPLINQLAPAFGLTVENVDAMFLACPAYPRL